MEKEHAEARGWSYQGDRQGRRSTPGAGESQPLGCGSVDK